MNAIPMDIKDASGNIDFAAWEAKDAEAAASFGDKAHLLQDAQVGIAFLTPQLHRIETEVYQIKYPAFDFRSFMHVNEDGDMWDVGTIFYSMDDVGEAKFLDGNGYDMPYADNIRAQHSRGFHLSGIGYSWNLQEMQRAAKLGRALSSDKARAADKVANAFIYSIAMTGNAPGAATSEKGWSGIFNNPDVPTANVAGDGTGSSTKFADKTPDKILRDINLLISSVHQQTNETHIANTVALPTSTLTELNVRTMSDNNSDTVLKFIIENNAYKLLTGQNLTIKASRELENAGASNSKRMIAYENDRDVVQLHLPGKHQYLPPFQKSSMVYEVAGIMNVGGVEFRTPKGASYRDGI